MTLVFNRPLKGAIDMEQNRLEETVKQKAKKSVFTLRFDRPFLKKVAKLVDRANKRPLGKR